MHPRKFVYCCLLLITQFVAEWAVAESSLYSNAMSVKSHGDYHEAESLFQDLVDNNPESGDYWFQLGLVQRYQGKFEQAFVTQQRALTIAPENNDIKLELARLYDWLGNSDRAEMLVREILKQEPGYEEARQLASSIERSKHANSINKFLPWQLNLGYEHSRLANSLDNWDQYHVQFGRWTTENTLVYMRSDRYERFAQDNQLYELGVSHRFNATYSAYLQLSYSPDADFLPRKRFVAGGEAMLIANPGRTGDTWLTGHIQHDVFSHEDITLVHLGVRFNIQDNLQTHLQYIDSNDNDGNHLNGWSIRFDWYTPLPELRIYAGYADSPEEENGVILDVTTRFTGLAYQFSSRVTGYASIASDDVENAYERDTAAVGLAVRF